MRKSEKVGEQSHIIDTGQDDSAMAGRDDDDGSLRFVVNMVGGIQAHYRGS